MTGRYWNDTLAGTRTVRFFTLPPATFRKHRWYRRSTAVILFSLFLPPVGLAIVATGQVFYVRGDQIRSASMVTRILLGACCAVGTTIMVFV